MKNEIRILLTLLLVFLSIIMAQFKENPLWISAFYQEPNLQNGKWLFWQYSYKGFIKGIDTSVDLNVFNGTAADFEKFIKQN